VAKFNKSIETLILKILYLLVTNPLAANKTEFSIIALVSAGTAL
jgi:hypothetical protein